MTWVMSSDNLPGWYLEPYILCYFLLVFDAVAWQFSPANQPSQFLNSVLTGAAYYLQALLIALCYTANMDLRGATAHFYIITIPAQMMPYCLLLVQLLFPGGVENLKVGLTGIVAAHLHDFLTRIYPEFGNGPNLLPTPSLISYIITSPRIQNTGFGTRIMPKANPAAGGGGGGGPLPDAWRSKGPGRRLG